MTIRIARRLTAGLVVVYVAASGMPVAVAPPRSGEEAQAITSLRVINAAQLLYSTTYNRLATSLDELETMSPLRLGLAYRFEMILNGDRYAAIAVPLGPRRGPYGRNAGPLRAFCVDNVGAIYQTLNGLTPEIDAGRCRDTSRPIH